MFDIHKADNCFKHVYKCGLLEFFRGHRLQICEQYVVPVESLQCHAYYFGHAHKD